MPTWRFWSIIFCFIFLGIVSGQDHSTRSQEYHHESSVRKNHMIYERSGDGSLSSFTTKPDKNDTPPPQVLSAGNQQQRVALSSSAKKVMLTPEEDKDLEYVSTGQRYSIILSIDCSLCQHWQSCLALFSAMKVRQPGHVTMALSWSNPEEAVVITEWSEQSVQCMRPNRFHKHKTYSFSEDRHENGKVIGESSFFNKPYGLKHLLENFDLIGFHGWKNDIDKDRESKEVLLRAPGVVQA